MVIGIISDTHGWLHPRIKFHFQQVDEIWHAGDIGHLNIMQELEQLAPVVGVYGNIDHSGIRRIYPEWQAFEREGKRILMTHIAGYPGKYVPAARKRMNEWQPDIFVCGHSHIVKIMQDSIRKHLHINPGAAGNHGWHKVITIARFRLETSGISDFELIELGPRSREIEIDE